MRRKPLIVGIMPGRYDLRIELADTPLRGPCELRLARLAGMSVDALWDACERVNLVRQYDILLDSFHSLRVTAARRGARRLAAERVFADRLLVLCGRDVADAMGLYDMKYLAHCDAGGDDPAWKADAMLIPHPSGRCFWWNDKANVEAASKALREAML